MDTEKRTRHHVDLTKSYVRLKSALGPVYELEPHGVSRRPPLPYHGLRTTSTLPICNIVYISLIPSRTVLRRHPQSTRITTKGVKKEKRKREKEKKKEKVEQKSSGCVLYLLLHSYRKSTLTEDQLNLLYRFRSFCMAPTNLPHHPQSHSSTSPRSEIFGTYGSVPQT